MRRPAEVSSAESACLWCSSVYHAGAYSSKRSNSIFNASSTSFCSCPDLSLSRSRLSHPLAGAIPRSLSLARLQCDPRRFACFSRSRDVSAQVACVPIDCRLPAWNSRATGRRGSCYWPVPVSVAVCGLPGALSLTCRVALYVALLLGVNTTLMLHDEPAANVLVQVRD